MSTTPVENTNATWEKKEANYKRVIQLAKKALGEKQTAITKRDGVIKKLRVLVQSKNKANSNEENTKNEEIIQSLRLELNDSQNLVTEYNKKIALLEEERSSLLSSIGNNDTNDIGKSSNDSNSPIPKDIDSLPNDKDSVPNKTKSYRPSRVLCRVEETTGRGDGQRWCLVEYDNGTKSFWECLSCNHFNDLELESCEMCGAEKQEKPETLSSTKLNSSSNSVHLDIPPSGWEIEDVLIDRAMKDFSMNLSLPAVSLTESEVEQLQDDLQLAEDQLVKIKAEYRRYRVRAELSIRQKETSLKNAEEELKNTFGSKVKEIAGTDMKGELKRLNLEIDYHRKKNENTKMECEQRLKESSSLSRECNELRTALDAAHVSSAQWRQKYEEAVQAEREKKVRGAKMDFRIDEKYQKLKREFSLYKTQSLAMIEERESILHQALQSGELVMEGSGTMFSSGEGVNSTNPQHTQNKYLRNVILQYMTTTDSSEKKRIEMAVGTMLQFTNEERALVDTRNVKENSWIKGW